jgi:hypothetical protein
LWVEFGEVGGGSGAEAAIAVGRREGGGAEGRGESGGGGVVEREIVGFGGEKAGAGGGGGAAGEDGFAGWVGCDGGEGDWGAGEGGVGGGEAAEANSLVDYWRRRALLRDADGVAVAYGREWCEWEQPGWSVEGAGDPGVLIGCWCEGGLSAGGEQGGA